MPALVAVLFGLSCAGGPCAADGSRLEREVAAALARSFEVRPAPAAAARPGDAEPADEAARLGADRLLSLELDEETRRLRIVHYVRGVVGAYASTDVACERGAGGALECPGLAERVLEGLKPRRVEDVDFVGALRGQARLVGACVLAEDRVPIEERIFGRVSLELEATPEGRVRVRAIAPARVARSELGRCLKNALQAIQVGGFEGEPVRFTVPIDLD